MGVEMHSTKRESHCFREKGENRKVDFDGNNLWLCCVYRITLNIRILNAFVSFFPFSFSPSIHFTMCLVQCGDRIV